MTEMSTHEGVTTPRLEVRLPSENDRLRLVDLFTRDDFMVFSGRLSRGAAHIRFEHMLVMSQTVPFAKQPIVERASGAIIGYTGGDRCAFEGHLRLEWGYRLLPECRGRGYATEASLALLTVARESFTGELLAIIDPLNTPSQRTCRKLGFNYHKQAPFAGAVRIFYTLVLGTPAR